MISRARASNHYFIDATFHHPKDYAQLLIIIFKDIVSSDYLPGFYILCQTKQKYCMI